MVRSSDDAAKLMVEQILAAVAIAIPTRVILEKVFAHPWLNDTCRRAFERKRAAFGTRFYEQRQDECSFAFLTAYDSYGARTRTKLKDLPPSSRSWWKLSSSLLQRAGAKENIPPLKRDDDTWALSAEERAAELAKVFRSIPLARVRRKQIQGAFPQYACADAPATAVNIHDARPVA